MIDYVSEICFSVCEVVFSIRCVGRYVELWYYDFRCFNVF